MKSNAQSSSKKKQSSDVTQDEELFALIYGLRCEFSLPVECIIGYSEILLDEASAYQLGRYSHRLNNILVAGKNIQARLESALNLAYLGLSHQSVDLQEVSEEVRFAFRTEIHTVLGYCEDILECITAVEYPTFAADLQTIQKAAKTFFGYLDAIDRLLLGQLNELALSATFYESKQRIQRFLATIPPTGTASGPPKNTSARKGNVLVVENNPEARDLLIRRLEHFGFKAFPCDDLNTLIEKIYVGEYDLLLLQIVTSGMRGFNILKRIRGNKLYEYLPIIILSTLKEDEAMLRCLEMGADDYLIRPYNPVILRSRATSFVEKKILQDNEKNQLEELRKEMYQSESLLLSILPEVIVDDFNPSSPSKVLFFPSTSVVIVDIVDLHRLVDQLDPHKLMSVLDCVFTSIDNLLGKNHIEKIARSSGTYIAIGGALVPNMHHTEAIANFALDVVDEIKWLNTQWNYDIHVKIAIDSGPSIGAVLNLPATKEPILKTLGEESIFPELNSHNMAKENSSKLMYKLFGTPISNAKRLLEDTLADTIHVSEFSSLILNKKFILRPREKHSAEETFLPNTYLLLDRKIRF